MTHKLVFSNTIRRAIVALSISGSIVGAQSAHPKFASRMASRVELESAVAELDLLAASTAYGERIRGNAQQQASGIRRRLTDGDFRPGDRIALRVEGQLTVNDTLTVLEGVRVAVPNFRQVSLAGVLRSELEARIRSELTDVVRNATVTARPLVRVAITGAVARPGYVSAPPEITIDGLLMLAGGPVADADMSKMTLMRADTVLLDAPAAHAAITRGSTISQLELTDADALSVPRRALPWDRGSVFQILTFSMSIVTILIFRRR